MNAVVARDITYLHATPDGGLYEKTSHQFVDRLARVINFLHSPAGQLYVAGFNLVSPQLEEEFARFVVLESFDHYMMSGEMERYPWMMGKMVEARAHLIAQGISYEDKTMLEELHDFLMFLDS